MSGDEVVASDVPPRYLLLQHMSYEKTLSSSSQWPISHAFWVAILSLVVDPSHQTRSYFWLMLFFFAGMLVASAATFFRRSRPLYICCMLMPAVTRRTQFFFSSYLLIRSRLTLNQKKKKKKKNASSFHGVKNKLIQDDLKKRQRLYLETMKSRQRHIEDKTE